MRSFLTRSARTLRRSFSHTHRYIDRVTEVKSKAEFIIIVEKDAAFMRLAEDRFYNRLPCIIITGKGQPDVATRMFVQRLKRELQVRRGGRGGGALCLRGRVCVCCRVCLQLGVLYRGCIVCCSGVTCNATFVVACVVVHESTVVYSPTV